MNAKTVFLGREQVHHRIPRASESSARASDTVALSNETYQVFKDPSLAYVLNAAEARHPGFRFTWTMRIDGSLVATITERVETAPTRTKKENA